MSTSAERGRPLTLAWCREDAPRWDADKQRVCGDAELAAVGLGRPAAGQPVADEWWRVTDESGTVVGYGWLDTEWGDARISFVVTPDRRGAGIGRFILDHLEAEARSRGLNYIYNVVPATHQDRGAMASWLARHGFRESARGELRRQVRPGPLSAGQA